jgi:hypothetical protein
MSFNPDKTEIMLFFNTDVRYNFNFTFNVDFVYLTYILIFAEYLNVLIRLRLWLFHLASLDKVTPKCLWLIVELNTWSTKWLMSFNPDKTEIMVFSNADVGYNFNFHLMETIFL